MGLLYHIHVDLSAQFLGMQILPKKPQFGFAIDTQIYTVSPSNSLAP